MSTDWRRAAELTSAAVARGLRERFVEPRAIRSARRRASRALLRIRVDAGAIGDAEIGAQILEGTYRLAGQTVAVAAPKDLWTVTPPSPAWIDRAHRFAWLNDLAALGPEVEEVAQPAVQSWIEKHGATYDPIAWAPDAAAERLIHWLEHSALIAPHGAGTEENAHRDALVEAISQHGEWLGEKIDQAPQGLPRIRVASAVALATLSLDSWKPRLAAASLLLEEAFQSGLREDGGVVGRRPDAVFEAMALGMAVRAAFQEMSTPPPVLSAAIAKLSLALRFFRMGDGGAPLFHGGQAIDDGRIDLALAQIPLTAPIPKAMPDSGYARMGGGRVAVIMDVGRAPGGADAEIGHASCLAFEMISGRRRIVVNCGMSAGMEERKRRDFRRSQHHSTLIVDEASCAQPRLSGRWAFGEDRAIVGPPETHAERKEERNGVWILGAHDGYFDAYGLTTTRRMFLSVDGGDFRGEDSLEALDDGARIFERRLGATRGKGLPFAARFHLHPDVSADLVAEGEAVTLRLPHGEVWVMRQAGGQLSLTASSYAPSDGPPVRSRQIVITAMATKRASQIRWAFRRVGEISQLPLDIDALAPSPGVFSELLESGLGREKQRTSPPRAPSRRRPTAPSKKR